MDTTDDISLETSSLVTISLDSSVDSLKSIIFPNQDSDIKGGERGNYSYNKNNKNKKNNPLLKSCIVKNSSSDDSYYSEDSLDSLDGLDGKGNCLLTCFTPYRIFTNCSNKNNVKS